MDAVAQDVGEVPVFVAAADQHVGVGVVKHGQARDQEGVAVVARAGAGAGEVGEAGRVGPVRGLLGQDGVERRHVVVERGRAADQEGLGVAAVEHVGPRAADHDVVVAAGD